MRGQIIMVMAILLSLIFTFTFVTAKEHVTSDVIVIGAGISGITATKSLIDSGLKNVTILEATGVIGGRMRAQAFNGLKVEIGANWVTGLDGDQENPIYTLAKKIKLRFINQTSRFDNVTDNTYDKNGYISPDISETVWEAGYGDYYSLNNLGQSFSTKKMPDISLGAAQRLNNYIPVTALQRSVDYFIHDYENGVSPDATSLIGDATDGTSNLYGDQEVFVADQRGYAEIVNYVASTVLTSKLVSGKIVITDPRVKLNKVVTGVSYSTKGCQVSTADGSTYTASHCIVTVSLGVLQTNKINFVLALPEWKREALAKMIMSVYTKIFIKFPYTFWPTDTGTNAFVYAGDRRGYFSVWQHFELEYPGSNILLVTVTGDEAIRIEQQSDNDTLKEAMAVLRQMFGPHVPYGLSILVPRWFTNPFFGGSYSARAFGVTSKDYSLVKQPIGRLYFAGEHTSEAFFGYTQGGYDSGLTVASLVANCYKKNKCF